MACLNNEAMCKKCKISKMGWNKCVKITSRYAEEFNEGR